MRLTRKRLLAALALLSLALLPKALESLGLSLALALGISLALGWGWVLLLLHRAVDKSVRRDRLLLEEMRQNYSQSEAREALLRYLRPAAFLPPTRGWAASPDLLVLLVRLLERSSPQRIVELGSGVSTIVMAHVLERRGAGHLIALEHDAEMAEVTRGWLAEHGLEERVEVAHAPLTRVSLRGEEWLWYDLDRVRLPERVDFLFVDGPPGDLRPLVRYPALGLLGPRLSPGATVVLDDSRRSDEAEIVRRWSREIDSLDLEDHDLEKGACVIRWPDIDHG